MDLKRGRIRQPDEVAAAYLLKIDLAAAGKFSMPRRHQHQPVLAEQKPLEIVRQGVLGRKTEIRGAGCDRSGYIGAFAFLDIDIDIWMFVQECRKRLRQMLRQTRGVGEQMHAGPHAACVSREIAAQRFHIVDDDPGVVEQAFARRGQLNAAAAALQKRNAKRCFQALDPRARRRQREMGAERAARNAAFGRNRDKQLEFDQVETHGDCPGSLPSSWPKARSMRCRLCPELRSVNVVAMFEPLLILIAAAFLLAGFIKGAIGMGLPTVSMGLLAVTMQPSRALAIVIVPAIITNIWQTFVGPYLRDIIRRLWPQIGRASCRERV